MHCQSYGHSEDAKELVLRNQLDGVRKKSTRSTNIHLSQCLPNQNLTDASDSLPHKTLLQTR